MDQMIATYEKTIRDIGMFALKALMWLNAMALLSVWSPVVRATGVWSVAAPHFLTGIIANFAALLVTYLAAQVAFSGRVLGLSWFVFMVGFPALSLLFFCLGINSTYPLMVAQ